METCGKSFAVTTCRKIAFSYTCGARLTCSEMQSKWSPVLRLFILHHAVEQSSTISDHLELDLDKNEYKIALPQKNFKEFSLKIIMLSPSTSWALGLCSALLASSTLALMVFLPGEFP